MCGFTGFYNSFGFNIAKAEVVVMAMRDQLSHRGPDDAGIWVDGKAGIALAHRRLSILDHSPTGHQPMKSKSDRFVLVFNGEIYNHLDLRLKLEAHNRVQWLGTSDTESLLTAIEVWGLEKALRESIGMFSFALWDRQKSSLVLARDRMGEKPLYYGWQDDVFLFGSELKALREHPAFLNEVDRDTLPLYLRHGYIPAPWSVWKGIRKLLPGTIVQFTAMQRGAMPDPTPFWSLNEVIVQGQTQPFVGSDQEAINALEQQLMHAISGQCIADVPVGAFLSGGIDSSTVVALMQAQSNRPVKTFSIGFHEAKYNEAIHAKTVAAHLGTEHTELYVTSEQAQDVIPSLHRVYDEPFGDSSSIPTFLVSKLARQKVTVSLSGDGGDELFGGYDRYFNTKAENIWNLLNALPVPIRRVFGKLLRFIPLYLLDEVVRSIYRVSIGRSGGRSLHNKVNLIADLTECMDYQAFYRHMVSQWRLPPVTFSVPLCPYGFPNTTLSTLEDSAHRMMASDSFTYLPDDILCKVDRAAMAVSLESRIPLLDHRVVELAWRMPYNMKMRDGQGKWLLKQVLHRYIPRELIDRPKKGFAVPVNDWLRGPLRDWSESLLSESRINNEGFLDPKPIRRRWQEHVDGSQDWSDSLWLILMWQAWVEESL